MERDDLRCGVCGDRLDPAGAARQQTVCYGCHLDGLLPPGYERREDYAWNEVLGVQYARRHPPTGVQILDATPLRISDLAKWLLARRIACGTKVEGEAHEA